MSTQTVLRNDIDLGEAFPHDRFEGETGRLIQAEYQEGGIALMYQDEMGQPVAKLTLNPHNHVLDEGEVAIKNYSENEGVLEYLVDEEIVSEPKRTITQGRVDDVPICDILIEP